MGGLGKTTLARALYNKRHSEYDGSVFVERVGEKSKNRGTEYVKKELISALLGDKNPHTSSYDMMRLGRKEVFTVFDDVDNYDQVNNLVGRRDWFKPGSKILITTRDTLVLGTKVNRDDIYELKGLASNEAFQLFSSHAFGKDCPIPDPNRERLAKKVTRYANGNPLALKVLGSSLSDERDQNVWESRLEKLQKLPDPQTNEGCLSIEDVEAVRDLLKTRRGYSIYSELKRLRETALLEVDEFGRISMHDLLREMGRQVVRDESPKHLRKRSRLWDPKEIYEILRGKAPYKRYPSPISHSALCMWLLKSGGIFSDLRKGRVRFRPFRNSHQWQVVLLRDLRRLEAGGCNELASRLLSKCDKMRALGVLWLPHCNELSKLPNDIRLLSSLRELNLSRTRVQTLPSRIKHLSRLQRLQLDGCKRLDSLSDLPPSILELYAANCISLKTIQYLPLTNEGEEGKDKACLCIHKLQEAESTGNQSCEARALVEINKAIYGFARLEYPRVRLPKWFKFKSNEEDPMTVNLSSIPRPWDGRFFFGAVVSEKGTDIEVRWFVDGQYACRVEDSSFLVIKHTSSDHVCVWYRLDSLRQLKRKIEEKERDAQSRTYRPYVDIKFRLRKLYGRMIAEAQIKECGPPYVCSGIHALVVLSFNQCTSSLFSSDHRLPPRHQSAADFAINYKSTMGLGCPFHKEAVSSWMICPLLLDLEEFQQLD
ncbi:TMV resistance protein N-like [Neltuma alba]|uniref:TMV resistance protein N-like n=1 Tax=Neltuma alba TaxID=207710 RepID=UPI0010A2E24E|nr:TMV resistance protein N-like [Prosopis alba]